MAIIDYSPFDNINCLQESVNYLKKQFAGIKYLYVSGTGFLPSNFPWQVISKISFEEIPYFPFRKNTYHDKSLLLVKYNEINFIVMTGRYHFYEGFSLKEIAYPIRVLSLLGIKNLIITSAVGGIHPDYSIGDYVIVKNHINFSCLNPLIGNNLDLIGPRFPSLLNIYNEKGNNYFIEIAKKNNINIRKGVLGFFLGPGFETKEELIFLSNNQVDLIGWSMVPETITAAHSGLFITAICVISDISDPNRVTDVSLEDIEAGATLNLDKFMICLMQYLEYLEYNYSLK